MTSQAVLYGPEGFISEVGVAVDQRPHGLEMRLALPISVDQLLMRVATYTCQVRGELVIVYCVDVMNMHKIFVSGSLRVEVLDQELEVPDVLHKDILLGSDGCAFRNHSGPRRHGSLSGLLQFSMLRHLGEPLLSGDSVDFVDGTSSRLPAIIESGVATEVVLPSRVVTFGQEETIAQWDDAV